MSEAMFAVQDAVYDLLVANAGMQAVLGNPPRIYDYVPQNAAFPYLTLGDTRAENFDTKDGVGINQLITLHAWSRYRGQKEMKDILKAVNLALHRSSMTVSGYNFTDCRFESAETFLDDDGLTYHGLCRYRLITQTA